MPTQAPDKDLGIASSAKLSVPKGTPNSIRSLYVHFPFCETKCHYCDFYSIGREKTQAIDASVFINALLAELALQKSLLAPELDTVFYGGGTPSMTSVEDHKIFAEELFKHTTLAPEAEWTMECNPSSVRKEQLRSLRNIGVNRISMGVQATRNDLLKLLGRVHDLDEAKVALESIFEAGFENVSTDLLVGVPGQSLKDIENSIEFLTKFPITHLSCYLLTLPKHHRMASQLPNDDQQLEHLLFVDKTLTSMGFDHYEISNFCRPGKEAKHNLKYWHYESYLGLGPSAHSFSKLDQLRWKTASSLHRYAKNPAPETYEEIDQEQQSLERWVVGVRLKEGFPKTWIRSQNQVGWIQKFLQEKWITESQERYHLTPLGFALSDQIIKSLSS